MKNNLLKLFALTLSLLLLLGCSACKKSAPDTEGTKEPEKTFKPAAEAGITDYGWIPASAFLGKTELPEWFEKSLARSSVNYAVLYAKDEATNIWYCWLYAEGYNAGDTVTLEVDDTNGTHVRMNATVNNPDADATGAFCFAIPSETEPTFSITVNGELESLIITLGKAPITPMK